MPNSNSQLVDGYGSILTVDDVSKILQVGRGTVYKLLRSQTIKNFKVGAVCRIPKVCLIEYISRGCSEE